MTDLLDQNLAFLSGFNSDLVTRLRDHSDSVSLSGVGDVLFGEQLVLPAAEQALLAAINTQLNKPNRLRMVRIENPTAPLPLPQLARQVVDRHGGVVMANLPNLNSHALGSQVASSAIPRDLLVLGSLMLLPIQTLLDQPQPPVQINSLTLVEADDRQLLALLQWLDLQRFVTRCRELGIGFNLIIESEPLQLQESLYSYLTLSLPLALHGLLVLDSPLRHPSLEELRGWLFSQSGVGYRFLGTLGSTTDELNQLMAAAWNALTERPARWMHPPAGGQACLDHTAVVVGSGPSLDGQLDWIAQNRKQFSLIAAGSAIGSLLRAGIKPDAAVFLERGAGLYDDLHALACEGHDLSAIRLIASITTDPRLRTLFGDVVLFQRPASTALALFPDRDSAALVHAGPESNNAAVDAALHLGFARLLLIGCDFAAVDRRHPRSRQAAGDTPRALDEPVRGNKGRTVFSEPSLLVARDALQASLRLFSQVQVRRLGEGAEIPSAFDTTPEQLVSDGWLRPGDPWPVIAAQCPPFEASTHDLASVAAEARSLLPGHTTALLTALRAEASQSWTMPLHRLFAPLFPQYPQPGTSPGQLLVHRLYREILFFLLAPLQRVQPGSPAWPQLVEELATAMTYVEALFDAVLSWVEQLTPAKVETHDWEPGQIADELAAIVEHSQLSSAAQS